MADRRVVAVWVYHLYEHESEVVIRAAEKQRRPMTEAEVELSDDLDRAATEMAERAAHGLRESQVDELFKRAMEEW